MLPVRLKSREGVSLTSSYIDSEEMLNVATIPQRRYSFYQDFLRTESGDIDLAVNALSPNTYVIWNGTGALDTDGDWSVSGPGTESSSAAHNGTNGWDTGVTSKDDILSFTSVSPIVLNDYSSLSFWVQPKNFPAESKIALNWYSNGSSVSNKLKVNDYAVLSVNNWSYVNIPVVDFGPVGSVDELRFRFEKVSGQQYWIDEIQLATVSGANTGPQIYRVSSDEEVKINLFSLLITTSATGWLLNDFMTIDGGLSSGLLIRYCDGLTGEVFWTMNLLNNNDAFSRFTLTNSVSFFDTDRTIRLDLDLSFAPIILKGTYALDVVVRDNLASLSSVRALATGGIRIDV